MPCVRASLLLLLLLILRSALWRWIILTPPSLCCSPPRPPHPPLCKLGADGLLWGSMEIARLAPTKRAALICFKVKQVQSRFISADPSVTPTVLAFNLGGEIWAAVLSLKLKHLRKEVRNVEVSAQPLLTAALTNAVQCVKDILILALWVTTLRTLTRVRVLSCHVRYCTPSSVGPQQLNNYVKVISVLVIIVMLQKVIITY